MGEGMVIPNIESQQVQADPGTPQPSGGSPTSATDVRAIWSNSSLNLHTTCPRKFELAVVKRLSPKLSARSLDFGSAIHSGLSVWYRTQGKSPDEVKAYIAKVFGNFGVDPEPLFKITSLPKLREEFMVAVACMYLPEPGDHQLGDRRTDEMADKLLRGYAKVYAFEPFKVLYVEQDVTFSLGAGHVYRTILDLIVDWLGKVMVVEHKTTGWGLSGFGDKFAAPNMQCAGEILGVKSVVEGASNDGYINGIYINTRKDGNVDLQKDFARPAIHRTDYQLGEFQENALRTIESIEFNLKRGYFDKNDDACNAYGGCPYKGICGADSAAEAELFAKARFEVRPYDPDAWKKERGHLL